MAVNRYFNDTKAWYAISTYSGYEDKVADSIRNDYVADDSRIRDGLIEKTKQIEAEHEKQPVR